MWLRPKEKIGKRIGTIRHEGQPYGHVSDRKSKRLSIHNIARWVRVRRDDASWGIGGREEGKRAAEGDREERKEGKESLGVLGSARTGRGLGARSARVGEKSRTWGRVPCMCGGSRAWEWDGHCG